MFFLSYSLYFLILFPLSTAFEVKEIKATSGEDVFLPCLAPKDSSITLLEWIRPDLKSDGYVFFYRNNRSYENYQHPAFHGRVKLQDKSSVKNGDVSLILKNVSNSDSGIYECQIFISNTGTSERTNTELRDFIRLTVTQSGGEAGVGLGIGLGALVVLFVIGGVVVFALKRKGFIKVKSDDVPASK